MSGFGESKFTTKKIVEPSDIADEFIEKEVNVELIQKSDPEELELLIAQAETAEMNGIYSVEFKAAAEVAQRIIALKQTVEEN